MRSRAAILYDVGGPWSVEEFELDPPRAGEVLVQLAAAGLCHSDDHILKGDMSAPNEVMRSLGLPTMFPMIGGHEGSGVVREVGEGVTDFEPGDHVVTSFVAVCGQCRWCATGVEYLCDVGIGTMVPGMPTDGTFRHHTADGRNLGHIAKVGTFAQHTVVSTNSLVKIEPHLPLVPSALLSCAIPTGYGSAAGALDATAFGALDYLLKPFSFAEVQDVADAVRRQVESRPRAPVESERAAYVHTSDLNLIGRIARTTAPLEAFNVIEIGPGPGGRRVVISRYS